MATKHTNGKGRLIKILICFLFLVLAGGLGYGLGSGIGILISSIKQKNNSSQDTPQDAIDNTTPDTPQDTTVRILYDESYEMTPRVGNSDYYYQHLSENQQKMYRMLYKEAEAIMFDGADKETLGTYYYSDYGITKAEANIARCAFYREVLDVFIISNEYTLDDTYIKIYVSPEFKDVATRSSMAKAIAQSVSEVHTLLRNKDVPVLRFKTIYDYVMNSVDYKRDDDGEAVLDGFTYSIAGALDGDLETGAICQGYAKAVSYLCNIFGIDNIYTGSVNANHAMNLLNIEGDWYYADATNDDNVGVDYKYFLCGIDDYWQNFQTPVGDKANDYLLSVLPELAHIERTEVDGALTYRITGKNSCKIFSCDKTVRSVTVSETFLNLSVTSIAKEAFDNCNFESISLSEGLPNIDQTLFKTCKNLKYNLYDNAKYLGNKRNPYVYLIDNASRDIKSCNIHPDTKRICFLSFFGCYNLSEIIIPSNVVCVDCGTFLSCDSLHTIIVEEGNARYCSKGNCIIEIETKKLVVGCLFSAIPNDGSVEIIGAFAFSYNKKITIPNNVIKIEEYAFRDCSELTDIQFGGTKEEWEAIIKIDEWDKYLPATYTIHCTDGDIVVKKIKK